MELTTQSGPLVHKRIFHENLIDRVSTSITVLMLKQAVVVLELVGSSRTDCQNVTARELQYNK
jgi:hypothetical protein